LLRALERRLDRTGDAADLAAGVSPPGHETNFLPQPHPQARIGIERIARRRMERIEHE
ncbi:MAG: hypothetical protein GTO18_00125, partial [Anaerolineales bacterium]|nr:hypothetical protein [Anaerolineales bacterium]